jgi:hypothetical protein
VRGRDRRIKERVVAPYIVNVIDTEVGVLEQVGGLSVDLKRVRLVEEVGLEALAHHAECITTDYF